MHGKPLRCRLARVLCATQQNGRQCRQKRIPERVAAAYRLLRKQLIQPGISLKAPSAAAGGQVQVTAQGGHNTILFFDFRYHRVLRVGLGFHADPSPGFSITPRDNAAARAGAYHG